MSVPKPVMVLLDPSDTRWAAFAATQSRAGIFHHPAWIKMLADCYGYRPFVVAVRDTDDRICAGLPMMEVNSLLTGRRWVSLPFTDHCVPLSCDAESLNCLSVSLAHLSQDRKIPRIELRYEFPFQSAARTCSHVLHTIPLSPDSDSVARRFHSTHRRNIKVAVNRGVRIERGEKREHLEAFFRLHLRTRRKQGVPVQPWRFFDRLGLALIEQGLGFVLLAYKDGECLAAAVFLHWQHTLTYKFGASAENGLNLRPNNLLFWTAIRWGCENGYTLFDMGRTDLTNSGLRAFKSGWGAEEIPLIYSVLSSTSSHPASGRLTKIMHHVIRRSPLWVCRLIGELLYGHFG